MRVDPLRSYRSCTGRSIGKTFPITTKKTRRPERIWTRCRPKMRESSVYRFSIRCLVRVRVRARARARVSV